MDQCACVITKEWQKTFGIWIKCEMIQANGAKDISCLNILNYLEKAHRYLYQQYYAQILQ